MLLLLRVSYVSPLSPSVSIETVYNAAKLSKEGENVKKIVYNETAASREAQRRMVPRQQSAAGVGRGPRYMYAYWLWQNTGWGKHP